MRVRNRPRKRRAPQGHVSRVVAYVRADARIALSVGQARGAVLVAASSVGVACAEYAPARVKQSVCGYGRADKQQVGRMVKAILSLDEVPTPHPAEDAL